MSNQKNLAEFSNSLASSASNTVTVTAGTGLSGGGSIPLGGSTTLSNAGVTSITAGSGISVSSSTGAVTVSAAGIGGQVFTSSGTFTVPSGVTAVKVTIIGGGGGGESHAQGGDHPAGPGRVPGGRAGVRHVRRRDRAAAGKRPARTPQRRDPRDARGRSPRRDHRALARRQGVSGRPPRPTAGSS